MSDMMAPPTGPDFALGVSRADIPESGLLAGHCQGKAVLLARAGAEVFAIGAHCTHYGAPLSDGLVVGATVRCPWHHACFSLRTGEAVAAPALDGVSRWEVEERGGRLYVLREAPPSDTPLPDTAGAPASVVIIGAGAAGNAAAEMLRRAGYAGRVTMIGAEATGPVDRPNLSKDYLAGNAEEAWIPLRADEFYRAQRIELLTGRQATVLDLPGQRVVLDDGTTLPYGALILATGADPVRLPDSVDPLRRAHYLRTLADSRAIIATAAASASAVVIGAGFIGLEVAASLRARGLTVHVVAPEARPLERILGAACGDLIRGLHEAQGVQFHPGRTVQRIDADAVLLDNGDSLEAALVVAGIGVRPNERLAASAGLTVDRGIVVDAYLETSAPGVYAIGDVARYPDARSGESIRVEHWVVAERQGQAAARNILGQRRPYADVPFFWSRHYDVTIAYVGHAERWDEITMAGSLEGLDCALGFKWKGHTRAVATIGRDRASLAAEVALARSDWKALDLITYPSTVG